MRKLAFPDFYPPLFYFLVALLTHPHLLSFAAAFKIVLGCANVAVACRYMVAGVSALTKRSNCGHLLSFRREWPDKLGLWISVVAPAGLCPLALASYRRKDAEIV